MGLFFTMSDLQMNTNTVCTDSIYLKLKEMAVPFIFLQPAFFLLPGNSFCLKKGGGSKRVAMNILSREY